MKEVVFKKLTGKNFLSLGNVPVVFTFPKGINIITGYNFDMNDENGVGKTTLIQLFFWTLFGEPLSDLKKDELINDINKKDCYGCLEFDIVKNGKTNSYKIERGIKPSYCKMWTNGDENKNLATIPATNEHIQALISSTPNIFRNCIVLSMNNSVPFMAQGKTERKTFVESMFRLETLRFMEKMARDKYNELIRQQELNLENQRLLEQNKTAFSEKKDTFETAKKAKIEDLENRKREYVSEIVSYKTKIVSVDATEINRLRIDIETKTSEQKQLSSEINTLKSEIMSLERDLAPKRNELKKLTEALLAAKDTIKSQTADVTLDKSLTIDEKEQTLKTMLADIPKQLLEVRSEMHRLNAENGNHRKTLDTIKKYGAICTACQRPFSKDEQAQTQKQIEQLEQTIEANKTAMNKKVCEESSLDRKSTQISIMLDFIAKTKTVSALKKEVQEKTTGIATKTSELEPLNKKAETIIEDLFQLNDKKSQLDNVANANRNFESQIANLEKFVKTVESDIEKARNEKNTFEEMIVKNQTKLDKTLESVASTKTEIQIYDNIKFIVSEDGIKSYIIKKLIKVLNERIAYYLKTFESNAKLTFDEYFDDTLYNNKGLPKSYENFSGGERKRIDLACLFSFLDIRRIQGDVRFNVIFFDELLDTAISAKGCNFIFNVLKERLDLYNENSYVITHRKEFRTDSRDLINNVINLEKRNGFTKIGDINGIKV